MKIVADYHTHTRHSHGKGTVLQNVAAAAAQGLEKIAISDHGPKHMWGIGIAGVHILDTIRLEIAAAQRAYPKVQVLLGVEANVTSIHGEIDIPIEVQSKLDVLQVGLHVMVRPEQLRDGLQRIVYHFGRGIHVGMHDKSRLLNTEAIVNAVYKQKIDIITHPGHRLNIDTRELAKACAKSNTAFEINTSHDHITPELIALVANEGVKFVIGSDAHRPKRVGDFAKGIALAKQAGLSKEQILNAH